MTTRSEHALGCGSAGFDFEGTYTRIVPRKLIEYRLGDGRRQGWQAILDNFAWHVEAKDMAGT